MGASNIAIVIGPNLLWQKENEDDPGSMFRQVSLTWLHVPCTCTYIHYEGLVTSDINSLDRYVNQ